MGPLATVRYLCKPIQTDIKTDTDILKRYGKIETGIYLHIFFGNTDNRYGKHIIFANGGDRNEENTPEYNTYQDDVEFVYGVGGDYKINSSSTMLENWKQPKVKRDWGWYRVLQDRNGYKIKELIINPNSSLSMQRHFKRAEHWYVLKGVCHLKVDTGENIEEHELTPNNSFTINKGMWHKGQNKLTSYCHILEIQHGEECIEEDIERRYGGGYTVDEIIEAVDHINNG